MGLLSEGERVSSLISLWDSPDSLEPHHDAQPVYLVDKLASRHRLLACTFFFGPASEVFAQDSPTVCDLCTGGLYAVSHREFVHVIPALGVDGGVGFRFWGSDVVHFTWVERCPGYLRLATPEIAGSLSQLRARSQLAWCVRSWLIWYTAVTGT